MSWNYRVVRRKQDNPDEPYYLQIHEIYYTDEGEIDLWSVDSVRPGGADLDELRGDLTRFVEALAKDVLDWDELEALATARAEHRNEDKDSHQPARDQEEPD